MLSSCSCGCCLAIASGLQGEMKSEMEISRNGIDKNLGAASPGRSSSSCSPPAVAADEAVLARWQSWMQTAEGHFVDGRFRASEKLLEEDPSDVPKGLLTAALARAIADANASICRYSRCSLRAVVGRDAGDKGDPSRRQGHAHEAAEKQARDQSVASLEAVLQSALRVAEEASGVAARTSSGGTPPGDSAASPAQSRQSSASRYPAARYQGAAMLAGAAEDVAVQIACALMTVRLERGEAAKALSLGLCLLAHHRSTSVGSDAIGERAIRETGAGAATGSTAAHETTRAPGVTLQRGRDGGSTFGDGEASTAAGERGSSPGQGSRTGRQRFGGQRVEGSREESLRDALAGADSLRSAFDSALKESARGLEVSEAAYRLLHLLRFSWLLATANLALSRPAAAIRILGTAEHSFGARRSAWRKATRLFATSLIGGSGPRPVPPSKAAAAARKPNGGGNRAVGAAAGGSSVAEGDHVPGGEFGGAGDPALAMCRFLRGLGLLAGGETDAAVGQMEESLELDPRSRSAAVCLAHLYCFASTCTAGGAGNQGSTSSLTLPREQTRWTPPKGRARELLRILSFGLAHVDRLEFLEGGGGEMRVGVRRSANDRGLNVRCEAFVEGGGGGVEACLLLACVARAAGDAGGAVSMFRKALALDPQCLEAVYGVARVLQEAGDHGGSRRLLLYLGERSQNSSGGRTKVDPTDKKNEPTFPGSFSGCLSFPLDGSGCSNRPDSFPWVLDDGAAGIGDAEAEAEPHAIFPRAEMLPAAPEEVMWRIARTSIGQLDWDTAILALKELAAHGGKGGALGGGGVQGFQRSLRRYFVSFSRGGVLKLSPGPGRARVLRALAYCQLRRGLYRDALDTSETVLRWDGARSSRSTADENEAEESDAVTKYAVDAAMLMSRADALVCLEEAEPVARRSLEHATELLNLRRIDMSLPASLDSSLKDSTRSTAKSAAPMDNMGKLAPGSSSVTGEGARESWRSVFSGGKRENNDQGSRSGHEGAGVENEASADGTSDVAGVALDRQRRVARAAAFNNRAVLLIVSGRGVEACRYLRACLDLLPGEPRPAFNLALALWRLGRPHAACAHWMAVRGWLWPDRRRCGVGAGGDGIGGDPETLARLLESARRRKALLESEREGRQEGEWGSGVPACSSHVIDGPRGYPFAVPSMQVCLLDIRTLRWWLDNAGRDTGQADSSLASVRGEQKQGSGGGSSRRTPASSGDEAEGSSCAPRSLREVIRLA